MVRMPAGHLPSPPMEAARLFPEPAAGEPYTILIMAAAICYMLRAALKFVALIVKILSCNKIFLYGL
jgi:hypothetical protein